MEEQLLLVAKRRPHHTCAQTWIVIAIVAWDGLQRGTADYSYDMLADKLSRVGMSTARG